MPRLLIPASNDHPRRSSRPLRLPLRAGSAEGSLRRSDNNRHHPHRSSTDNVILRAPRRIPHQRSNNDCRRPHHTTTTIVILSLVEGSLTWTDNQNHPPPATRALPKDPSRSLRMTWLRCAQLPETLAFPGPRFPGTGPRSPPNPPRFDHNRWRWFTVRQAASPATRQIPQLAR